jgi:hypothetical protein
MAKSTLAIESNSNNSFTKKRFKKLKVEYIIKIINKYLLNLMFLYGNKSKSPVTKIIMEKT